MMINSLIDLTRSQLFLLLAPFPAFARLLLGAEQRKAYSAYLDARAVFVKGGGFIHAYGDLTRHIKYGICCFPSDWLSGSRNLFWCCRIRSDLSSALG